MEFENFKVEVFERRFQYKKVISEVYAYVANPTQIGKTLTAVLTNITSLDDVSDF
jgi:Lhr-like helicase